MGHDVCAEGFLGNVRGESKVSEIEGAGLGPPIIALRNIVKRYGSVTVLKQVSLALRPGEVHMLMGENGAGKSTLVGSLIGTVSPEEGEIALRGECVHHYDPAHARAAGINAVLQDFTLAPSLRVFENMFLGRELTAGGIRRVASMRRRAAEAFAELGVQMDVDRKIGRLSGGEQQIVEIASALLGEPGALLLDEPTAALSHDESEKLFTVVARLRSQGWAILYITHRMEEMRRLGDVVTVIRDGTVIGHHLLSEASDEQIIASMVGRELTSLYPTIAHNPGRVALQTDGLSSADGKLIDVTVQFRGGEVLGIGGLVGCGKSELVRACFGLQKLSGGSLTVEGQSVMSPTPRSMLGRGVVYLSQDRRGEALALSRSILDNIEIGLLSGPGYTRFGLLRKKRIRKAVSALVDKLDVRPRRLDLRVDALSGGNQQKVVIGRALTRDQQIYIFDEPTAGVDVGARQEIYGLMKQLCEQGATVVLVSSDLQELLNLSHRVVVMHRGRVQAELTGDDINEAAVVGASFGSAQSGNAVTQQPVTH